MLGFIAVVILAGGGFFLVSNRNKLAIQTVTEEETVNSGALVPDESSPTVADTIIEETASVKTFEIKASSFKFSLTEIRVKKATGSKSFSITPEASMTGLLMNLTPALNRPRVRQLRLSNLPLIKQVLSNITAV